MKITLLDGSVHDRDVLLNHMHDNDFYYGHLGKQALSSSAVGYLLQSPKVYSGLTRNYVESDSTALQVGQFIHTMILEPHTFNDRYEVVDVQSRVTKAFKETRSASDKTVLTRKEYDDNMRIVDAALNNEHVLSLIADCEFEVPEIAMVEGYPFRAKADIIDRPNKFMADLKTTRDVRRFSHSADSYNYDVQAWLYTHMFGIPQSNFKFVAIDKDSLDVGIFDVSPTFLNKGYKKVKEAIERYEIFFKHGESLDNYTLRGILE
jgi:hypothetical protein